jgi:hypothetical protein
MLKAGVTQATIHQRLRDETGLRASVASLKRYVAANLPEEMRRDRVVGVARAAAQTTTMDVLGVFVSIEHRGERAVQGGQDGPGGGAGCACGGGVGEAGQSRQGVLGCGEVAGDGGADGNAAGTGGRPNWRQRSSSARPG